MPRFLPDVTTTNVVKMIGSTCALALVAASVVSLASYDQRVTLDVDGRVLDVRTTADTVGDFLEDQGVSLTPEDRVSVPVATAIDGPETVVVRTAKPVTLVVDGTVTQNTVHDWTVRDTLKTLGLTPREGAHLSADLDDRITNRGISLIVSNPKTITVRADGKKRTITTAEPTVADVLAELDVRLDDDDEVNPGLGSYVKPSQALRVVRIETVRREETLQVDFPVTVTKDNTMFQGETTVLTAGRHGADRAMVEVVLADGKVRERTVISRDSIREPITQVERRGTKNPDSVDGGVWDRLAQCESGGNWKTNTGNGFYGGLQFSASTWRAVGGTGLPHQNSKAEQIKRGKILQQRAGWGQWPACTKKLGLR